MTPRRRREITVGNNRPVAVVTSTIPITMDKFHRELIRQVQTEGYDVCALELERLGQEMGVRVRPLLMTRNVSPLTDLVALVRWLLVCRAERPSLVVSAIPKASLRGLLAGKATRRMSRAGHHRYRATVRALDRHENPLPRNRPHPALRGQNPPLTPHEK
jgi:hypothetical protein